MAAQLAGLRSTGLAEDWLTMFSEALASIGEGGDYHAQLDSAGQRLSARLSEHGLAEHGVSGTDSRGRA